MAIKAILFDMDGTLVDSEKVSFAAWRATAESMGLDIPEGLVRSFVGRNYQSYRALLIDHLAGDEELGDRVLEQHTKDFFRIAETSLELKFGARECLDALRQMGLPLAVATSTPRTWAIPRLDRFGLRPEFATVTCGDEVENGKPAPDIFLASAASLGVDPADCAVIEDSFNGVRSGYAAGAQVFMIPDMLAPTDEISSMCSAVLETLHELPAAIEAVR